MSMSYHVKQLVVWEFFFQKGLVFLENCKTGFFSVLIVGETVSILKICESRQRDSLF